MRLAPSRTVSTAYDLAADGRRQAALAAARVASLLRENPGAAAALSEAAIAYLSGTDLTGQQGPTQATAQAIVRRLTEALDGHSLRVTQAILDEEAIARLRIFRQQVRELIKAETASGQRVMGESYG
jgi:hypothetical protein